MSNTVAFLWISAAVASLPSVAGPAPGSVRVAGRSPGSVQFEGSGPKPSARALADLSDFGAARGLSLVPVPETRPSGLQANDAAMVDALEGELEQARTALSALEEASAGARLKKVHGLLLAHPHLPQAAFLMGECLALEAQAARELDPSRAAALDARRIALEGPRALAFGEAASAARTTPALALPVAGLAATDQLELDGVALADALQVSVAPGLHHARVWRDGRPIFAVFSEVTPDQQTLSLGVPPRVPCSAEDLEFVPRWPSAERAALPAGITCARWAQVRDDQGSVAIALCERNHCGAFVHWQRRTAAPFAPISADRAGFPSWAGFAIAGASAVVASGLLIWQSGALTRGHPNAATWQYVGVNPQGLRF